MRTILVTILLGTLISCAERDYNNLELKNGVFLEKIDTGFYKFTDGDIVCYTLYQNSVSCVKIK